MCENIQVNVEHVFVNDDYEVLSINRIMTNILIIVFSFSLQTQKAVVSVQIFLFRKHFDECITKQSQVKCTQNV